MGKRMDMRRYHGSWESVGDGEYAPVVLVFDKRPEPEALEIPRVLADRPGRWDLVANQLAIELLADALDSPVVPSSLVQRFRFDVVECFAERWELGAAEVRQHADRLRMEILGE